MLLSFTLENWMSFRDPVTFSMIASKERQHGDRLPRVKKYQMRILPIAAIYGGNASGKTNFFKALAFARDLVVRGTEPRAPIRTRPFKLEKGGDGAATKFSFELLIDETIYELVFSVTQRAVLEESLVRITSSNETLLYERKNNQVKLGPPVREGELGKLLQFASRGTRENQLFLTNATSQNVDVFKPIADWFRDSLQMVAPGTRFSGVAQIVDQAHPLHARMNEILPTLDTGISQLGGEDFPFENVMLPEELRAELEEKLDDGGIATVDGPGLQRYVVAKQEGVLKTKKLVTYHTTQGGDTERFEMSEESDGTLRLIDLLPALIDATATESKRVLVIDELDRSLHTLLTRSLLEWFLETCTAKSRAQVLFTTHDALLMDQNLLRRDEMWLTERKQGGSTDLFSFSDFDESFRYDKDIRKLYLKGRVGGIPRILPGDLLVGDCDGKQ